MLVWGSSLVFSARLTAGQGCCSELGGEGCSGEGFLETRRTP